MAKGKRLLKYLIGILKDKASLTKTSLSIKRRHTSTIHAAVIRATTHDPLTPPSDKNINTILSFGHGSRATASTCIKAVMDRLHNTGRYNAFVALKCLLILHNIIMHGSFILKDQLSFYPYSGGHNFLNLSRFRDDSDADTWEVSSWVRWHANVVEQNLIVSRVLGYFLSLSFSSRTINKDRVSGLSNSGFVKEVESLVGLVEQVGESPDSLYLQKNNLVYEVVKLVAENYRMVQHEISIRVTDIEERMDGFSSSELTQLLDGLKRLEDCRERLSLLFVNRKRNDALWDLISQAKMRLIVIVREKKEREERRRLVIMEIPNGSTELTRFGEPSLASRPLVRLELYTPSVP